MNTARYQRTAIKKRKAQQSDALALALLTALFVGLLFAAVKVAFHQIDVHVCRSSSAQVYADVNCQEVQR